MATRTKAGRRLPLLDESRTAAVCPLCGRPSRTRSTICGGPDIAQLCNDCRRDSLAKGKLSVQFCVGGCCTRAGARPAMDALLTSLRAAGALGAVSVVPVDCMDMCEAGPVCRVLPDRKTARRVRPSWAAQLGSDLARDRRARR
jgi:(2Fe-2S) ferredoxin